MIEAFIHLSVVSAFRGGPADVRLEAGHYCYKVVTFALKAMIEGRLIEEMTMRILTVPTLALAALTMSVAFGAPGAGVSAQNVGEKFTAFAINMNSGPKTATIDISIDRWSTDAEREQLLSILQEEKDAVPGESGAAQGPPEIAEGRLLSHAADPGVGPPLCAAEPDGGRRPPDCRRDRSSGRLSGKRATSRGPWTIRLRSSRCG